MRVRLKVTIRYQETMLRGKQRRDRQLDLKRTRCKVAAASGPYLDIRRSLRRGLRSGGELIAGGLYHRRRGLGPFALRGNKR